MLPSIAIAMTLISKLISRRSQLVIPATEMTMATDGLARIGSTIAAAAFGINPNLTDFVAKQGANLITLKFSRDDETEADLVGMELAAQIGRAHV